MPTKILTLVVGAISLLSCSTERPDIQALCSRDDIGNYVIKWEMNPVAEGVVDIYVSNHPDKFGKKPALSANIRDGIATYITKDNITRNYFKLVFNKKHSQIVGARIIPMTNVQNMRDLGGYYNKRHEMIRWGKVYRSGELDNARDWDITRLKALHIKTIIDLRGEDEVSGEPLKYKDANVIYIPIKIGNLNDMPQRIREGRMRKGDAMLYMQDQYINYITKNSDSFSKALDVFLHKENYPILFNCTLGKDRAGFLAALLLAALDIPEETITRDYVMSQDHIDVSHLWHLAEGLSYEGQEAVTILLSSHESLLKPTLQKIAREYGSVEEYLEKKLDFSEKKRDKLKDILLQ